MTRLLLALNLTPTKLHDENLLHGAKLRKLIKNIEEEMEDYKGSPPPIWKDYEKELEKIRNETFTTLREKSLTKLGMKISGIASEVNKVIVNDQNLPQTGKIGKNQEDPVEIARKNLLRKIRDVTDVYNNSIAKETDPNRKVQLELSLMLLDLLRDRVTDEAVLSAFANHESELESIKREGTKPFSPSLDPLKKPGDIKHEDLVKFGERFESELADLGKRHTSRKYSWRVTPFETDKKAITVHIEALINDQKKMNERLVARNLAELALSRLAEKVRFLNIPVEMAETLNAKKEVELFVGDLDRLVGWVEAEFTVTADLTEIKKVLPTAVAKAKAPLQRLVDAIGQVESLLQGCTAEKETTLDSFGRQVISLAGLCITHCSSDQLLAAWDSCPQKPKKSVQELKTAIETISKEFSRVA